jgi:hypothetical protein
VRVAINSIVLCLLQSIYHCPSVHPFVFLHPKKKKTQEEELVNKLVGSNFLNSENLENSLSDPPLKNK